MINAVQVQVQVQFQHLIAHLVMKQMEMGIVCHHHHWYPAHQDLLSNQEAVFQLTLDTHQLQLSAQQENTLMDMEIAYQTMYQLFAIQVFKAMVAEAVFHFQFLCHKSALQDILQMEREHVSQLILN
jgi:hypothetical protein